MRWPDPLREKERPGSFVARASVAGLGAAQPAARLDNAAVAAATGVEEEWIVRRTGVLERPVAGPGETTRALAARAGSEACADAGVAPASLDAVLVATFTPDRMVPPVAPGVAHDLGATRALAFDVGAACSGFLAGLQAGTALVESGRAPRVLVVGADRCRSAVDPCDRNTSVLFADGAGAAVLVAGEHGGLVGPIRLGADGGEDAELITCEHGGTIVMAGHDTFRRAVAAMAAASEAVLADAGLAIADVDLVVPHQANRRICAAVAERLGIGLDRVVDDIATSGNTSAASVPLALSRAAGRLPADGHVLLTAFGAGLTWGAALLEWRSA